MARDKTAKQFKTRATTGQEANKEITGRRSEIRDSIKARIAKAIGRPTTYDESQGIELCKLISEGMSLTEACDALCLARSTVLTWAESGNQPAFTSNLARARESLAEHAFSEAYAIPKKLLALYDANPELKLDPARVQAARLATDTLKWYAERLKPRTFGEKKIEQSVTITNNALTIDSRELSQDQRDALRGALLAAKSLPVTIDHD
jgi:hypothetical protein